MGAVMGDETAVAQRSSDRRSGWDTGMGGVGGGCSAAEAPPLSSELGLGGIGAGGSGVTST